MFQIYRLDLPEWQSLRLHAPHIDLVAKIPELERTTRHF